MANHRGGVAQADKLKASKIIMTVFINQLLE
jgi:hypothetical protein